MADIEKAQNPRQSPIFYDNGLHSVANPTALGLFSFASTTFVISMYNMQTRGITTPDMIVGMAIFAGGLTQLLAGMWAFCHMNTFAATAFSSYGAFWLSYATIYIPSSGVIAAYADGPARQFSNAMGIYLIAWLIVTILFFSVALHKSVSFTALLGCMIATFALLAAGELLEKVNLTKAAGATGIIAAFIAYYVGLAELLAEEDLAIVRLPLGVFKRD